MQGIWKVVKYQLVDARKAILLFYGIILFLSLDAVLLLRRHLGVGQLGGLGLASAIFILVAGLSAFANCKFMLANGVSRRRFWQATTVTLLAVSVLMALLDVLIGRCLQQLIPYQGLMEQLYGNRSAIIDLCWSAALYACIANLGWLVTMLYYRSGTLLRVALSIAPVAIWILLAYVNQRVDGAIGRGIVGFLGAAFGLSGPVGRPFAAVGSLLVGSLFAAAGSFLLVRRVTIRE